MEELQKRIIKIVNHKKYYNLDIDDRNELREIYHVLTYQIGLNLLFPYYLKIEVVRRFIASLEKQIKGG